MLSNFSNLSRLRPYLVGLALLFMAMPVFLVSQDVATLHYYRCDGAYGNYSSSDFNDFWGLHVFGSDVTDTEWTIPLKPSGTDAYGVYFEVPLSPQATEFGFIVHRGDLKDGSLDQNLQLTSTGYEIWLVSGDQSDALTQYTSLEAAKSSPFYCEAQTAKLHYYRCDRDFGDYSSSDFNDFWGLHVFGNDVNDTEWTIPLKPSGTDAYGVYFEIPLSSQATEFGFIVHRGDLKDGSVDQNLQLTSAGYEIWLVSGDQSDVLTQYTSLQDALDSPENCDPRKIKIHYSRCDRDFGDYSSNDFEDFWGIHLWTGAVNQTQWPFPQKPEPIQDEFGVVFDIELEEDATELAFILHRGDTKDPGPDSYIDLTSGVDEIWLVSGALENGNFIQYNSRHEAVETPNYCSNDAFVVLHYYRCDEDYGNYFSGNFMDYWGIHLWTGSAIKTDWTFPLKPTGSDDLGYYFDIPLEENAQILNFIVHRGDLKDPGPDQAIQVDGSNNEFWLLNGDYDVQNNFSQYSSRLDAYYSSAYCGTFVIPTFDQWGWIIFCFSVFIIGYLILQPKPTALQNNGMN